MTARTEPLHYGGLVGAAPLTIIDMMTDGERRAAQTQGCRARQPRRLAGAVSPRLLTSGGA